MDDLDAPRAAAAELPTIGHRRVLSTAAMLGGATVLAKLAALAKDWLVARQLGAGDDLDAFLIAFLIPSYAVVVLAHSTVSAFVPTYIRVWQQQGLERAQRLAGYVLAAILGGLVLVTLALAAAAPLLLPLVGIDFDAAKLSLALSMFYPLCGVVIAAGASAVLVAILNAHERFRAAALAPMAIPLGTLAVFWMNADRYGVHALAAGTTAGFIGETCILVVAVVRHGLFVWPRFHFSDPELRHVAAQYSQLALGGLLMSSSLVVDQAMAASLGSGQVSILSYGGKIVAVVLLTVAASLSTALFPRFSRMIAADRWGELKLTVRFYAKAIVLGAIPLVLLLALFSEPLVRLLFQRGAFTPATTVAVTRVQLCLLPQIPFYILTMLGARVLSALDGNQIVLRIGALNLLVNVTGNYVLMQWFGVEGIAMATSVVYLVAAVVTLLAIRVKVADSVRSAAARGGETPA